MDNINTEYQKENKILDSSSADYLSISIWLVLSTSSLDDFKCLPVVCLNMLLNWGASDKYEVKTVHSKSKSKYFITKIKDLYYLKNMSRF